MLAAAPGSARALRELGGAGIRAVTGFSDEVAENILRAANNLCSFSADTLVMTEDGLKPISEVDEWELVLAYHEETGELGYYPVIAVWSHIDPVIVELTIDGETIETILEHPFLTADGAWTPAGQLEIGDEVRNAEWTIGTVEAVHVYYEPQPMYNFTVEDAHTYFVSEDGWLVHNACSRKLRHNYERFYRTRIPRGFDLHHMIPGQHEDHPLIRAATQAGWDIDGVYNGIPLDNPHAYAGHPGYNRYVLELLEDHYNHWRMIDGGDIGRAYDHAMALTQKLRNKILELERGGRFH